MTERQMIVKERDRVSGLLSEAVSGLEAEGGDLRLFAAALLMAAVQLHIEVEGVDGLKRALSRLAAHEMTRCGVAGRA
ncbi:hypothetical protein O4G76_09010 [Limimaricola sp. G21655-S1]|uniref:hypothetical protein n=1 Tax=Limimaricola sp. G21655-S1 TaxID=3014768 RepID=UPI0022AF5753|nr:hypothetical protein [Limimaricola sp. G21655-S1]MCZ4260974.1 hypothetical protein [Limimaricola sp. G21655-S1]